MGGLGGMHVLVGMPQSKSAATIPDTARVGDPSGFIDDKQTDGMRFLILSIITTISVPIEWWRRIKLKNVFQIFTFLNILTA